MTPAAQAVVDDLDRSLDALISGLRKAKAGVMEGTITDKDVPEILAEMEGMRAKRDEVAEAEGLRGAFEDLDPAGE